MQQKIIDLFTERDIYDNSQQFDEKAFVEILGIEIYKKLSCEFCGAIIYISDIRKRHNFIKRIIKEKLVSSDNHYEQLRKELNVSGSYIYTILREIKEEKEYLNITKKA